MSFSPDFEGHVVSIVLCLGRLGPVALMSPLLGAGVAPSHVRLAIGLSLACVAHVAAGVEFTGAVTAAALVLALFREVALGTVVGLLSSLPFDAARMGGSLIDLFRGSSAEAKLPWTESHESATGNLLYQLSICSVAAAGGQLAIAGALIRSFRWVQLGAFSSDMGGTVEVIRVVAAALSLALAIAAPVALAGLAVDLFSGLVARTAPSLDWQSLAAPVRLATGGLVTWLCAGPIVERVIRWSESIVETMPRILGIA